MNFAWALERLKADCCLTRKMWVNDSFIKIRWPGNVDIVTWPEIFIYHEGENQILWNINQFDIFATDWELIEPYTVPAPIDD